jgi:hypothetical protein
MALYETIKSYVDDFIYDNTDELITGAIHNTVNDAIIDAVGARQTYWMPATTLNPGTVQNPRSYIAPTGTYANFLTALATPARVTAPLGVISWDGGPYWTVTQITIPSPYNYFRAKTTQARSAGSPYTTVNIDSAGGGWEALKGEWVQLVNPRTGRFENVQLTVAMTTASTSITFKSRTFAYDMPIDSIVELYSHNNMRWWGHIPVIGVGGLTYVNVPGTWRMPPVEAVDLVFYLENLEVIRGVTPLAWASGSTPADDYQYCIDASDRTKISVLTPLSVGEVIKIKYRQPAVLFDYEPED